MTPLNATPRTLDSSMTPLIATDNAQMENDLLIRRSRVRNPPGSSSYATAPAMGAGESAGLAALKRAARVAVGNAIALGKLAKGPCEQAGPACSGPIQAHHDDYAQTLAVRWLCRGHHFRAHRGQSRHRCKGCTRILAASRGDYCSPECVEMEKADAAELALLFHESTTCRARSSSSHGG